MLTITIYLIFSMLVVLWYDVTSYTIPNWLSGTLLILYPLAVWMSPATIDWPMALAGMLIVFGVGYIIFIMKWMGGGDIKLISVCALWTGLSNLLTFLFIVSLLGAVLSIGVLLMRKIDRYLPKTNDLPRPRILRNGEQIPYGVAIAFGFIAMIWLGEIPAIVFSK